MKGKRYIFTYAKLKIQVPLIFLDDKVLGKGNNIIIGFCQKTRKVECMYLAFKDLKIRGKMVHHSVTKLKPRTNDVFRG